MVNSKLLKLIALGFEPTYKELKLIFLFLTTEKQVVF